MESLQSLRGVAISTVVLAHTVIWTAVASVFGVGAAYHTGDLGVDLFLVISGFVVTLSLHRSEFAILPFYARRFFRLTPALVVMLLVGIAVTLVARAYFPNWPMNTRSVNEPFRQAAYVLLTAYVVRVYNERPHDYCFHHTWSLNVEEQFYAAVGVLCLLIGWAVGRGNRDRILLIVGAASFVACLLLHSGRVFQPDWYPGLWHLDRSPTKRVIWYLINWRFDFLLSGVALYAATYWFRLRPPSNRLTSLLLVLTTIGPFFYVGWTGLKVNGYSGWAARTAYLVTDLSFLVAVSLAWRNVPLVPRGSIADRVLLYLGERSYSLYLFHMPFTLVVWMLLFTYLPKAQFSGEMTMGVFYFGGTVILTLPIAHLVHRYIELPGIALGHQVARRWNPPPPPPPVPVQARERLTEKV